MSQDAPPEVYVQFALLGRGNQAQSDISLVIHMQFGLGNLGTQRRYQQTFKKLKKPKMMTRKKTRNPKILRKKYAKKKQKNSL